MYETKQFARTHTTPSYTTTFIALKTKKKKGKKMEKTVCRTVYYKKLIKK